MTDEVSFDPEPVEGAEVLEALDGRIREAELEREQIEAILKEACTTIDLRIRKESAMNEHIVRRLDLGELGRREDCTTIDCRSARTITDEDRRGMAAERVRQAKASAEVAAQHDADGTPSHWLSLDDQLELTANTASTALDLLTKEYPEILDSQHFNVLDAALDTLQNQVYRLQRQVKREAGNTEAAAHMRDLKDAERIRKLKDEAGLTAPGSYGVCDHEEADNG